MSKTKDQPIYPFIAAAAAFAFLIVMASLGVGIRIALSGRADFRAHYAAGTMVRTGRAKHLYEYDLQHEFQNKFVSPEDVALPYNHAPFEALVFAVLSLVPYRAAYWIMLAINLGLVAFTFRLLRSYLEPLRDVWSWLPEAMFVCFLPFTITIVQGQDSILLAALLSASFVLLERGREEYSGAALALGLFKFQYIIPVALLFLIWRRWRFIRGFIVASVILGCVSLWLVGPAELSAYAHLLVSDGTKLSQSDQYRLGTYPSLMPNLRGLFHAIFHASMFTQVTTGLASFAVLLYAAKKKASFALAVLVSVLVSYQSSDHDLAVLILPTSVLLAEGLARDERRKMIAGAALIVAPTVIFLTGGHYFVIALLMVVSLPLAAASQAQTVSASDSGSVSTGSVLPSEP